METTTATKIIDCDGCGREVDEETLVEVYVGFGQCELHCPECRGDDF